MKSNSQQPIISSTWKKLYSTITFVICSLTLAFPQSYDDLKAGFLSPPHSAKPGVYWYFMDGNLTKESMTKDLESMKEAGIGNLLFLEVNVGLPRGPVQYFSEQWQELFVHAVRECERLNIEMSLGTGPGWNGSGGPWVKTSQSMQHLVANSVLVDGDDTSQIFLPIPEPKNPYFNFPAELDSSWRKLDSAWRTFYEDVAVLAHPTPSIINDPDEKALYYRPPYTSRPKVKQYFPATSNYVGVTATILPKESILDLSDKMDTSGILHWDPPPGKWTISRFGRRNNGATTRPAPIPALGFECDKFDTAAFNAHLDHFVGTLLKKAGVPDRNQEGGLKKLHIDSWEMGAQNWTPAFREEFIRRRGYDPQPFYPVYLANVIESLEISERFLWDLRQTAMELVLENHVSHARRYAQRHNMKLSIEPYDMNPASDLELGSKADIIMGEFWSKGYGYNSAFSCIEAASIAHINGSTLIPAEAFTSQKEGWRQYPGSMKNQGDWALAAGINRLVYHTFQNQFLGDSLKPGATMGIYGVHWNRNQTWWPMVKDYHHYISRCQFMLQQGKPVADILYLTPEGAPHVFRPPSSAIVGDTLPERRGYNFDGCAPGQLYQAEVKKGKIVFPSGASYHLLVLPAIRTMTPLLLKKITSLVNDGATIVGVPPVRSPSLSNYPACDDSVLTLSRELWGNTMIPQLPATRRYGKGIIHWGGDLSKSIENLYPKYELTAEILKRMEVPEDFAADSPVRYTHRSMDRGDIYFVSNTLDSTIVVQATFRSTTANPQIWNPITGEIIRPATSTRSKTSTTISLSFEPYESFFVVFAKGPAPKGRPLQPLTTDTLQGPWEVRFDTAWGGPASISFDSLYDWSTRAEEGIKYYSGIATYHKSFDRPSSANGRIFLHLGRVNNIARVWLNGKNLGVVWTAPWEVDITGAVLPKGNQLQIEVANLWVNRLIGDERLTDDGIRYGKWPEWIQKGLQRPSKRYTFTTHRHYASDAPLIPSGLLGPVTIISKTPSETGR